MRFLRRLDLTGEHDFGGDEPALGTGALSGFQTRGLGQSGGDDSQRQRLDGTRFYGQLGLAVRPVIAAGLEMLSLFDEQADEHVGIALLQRKTSHEVAVEGGETRVYAAGQPKVCIRLLGGLVEIRINTSGELRLAPDAADYKGEPVARKTDDVQVTIAPNTVVVGGSGTVLNALPITLSGVITSGALKVKA